MAKVNKATSILSHVNIVDSHDRNEELYVFYRTVNVRMIKDLGEEKPHLAELKETCKPGNENIVSLCKHYNN